MGVITFNGTQSTAFGIEVSSPPRYSIPEEDVAQNHVLGRNGDSIRRYQSFKNIQVSYGVTFLIPGYQFGDVDRNGVVKAADANLVRSYLTPHGATLDAQQLLLADIDHNGIVDEYDANQIDKLAEQNRYGDTSFDTNRVSYMSSLIASWLHPYFPSAKLKNRDEYFKVTGNFLSTKDGYCRLLDTYNPGFFRKAICKNAIEVANVYEQGGAANIVFECMPQKWYVSGETWVTGESVDGPDPSDAPSWYPTTTIGAVKKFYNPSLFGAHPILKIDYSGVNHAYLDQCTGTIRILNIPNEAITFDASGHEVLDWSKYGMVNEKVVTFKLPTTRSRSETNYLYIDFQNGTCYGAAMLYDVTPRIYTTFKHNDCVTSRIYKDTGLLTPRYNAIYVVINPPAEWEGITQQPVYPSFEILPRWWTL